MNTSRHFKLSPSGHRVLRQRRLMPEPTTAKASTNAPKILRTWDAICEAIGHDRDYRTVRQLNIKAAGPIILPPPGGRPEVELDELIAWWRRVHEERKQ